jgi:hypothetical protein
MFASISFFVLLFHLLTIPHIADLLCSIQVFGSGNFTGSGVEDSAFIQELEAAYTAAVSREGDCKLAEALLNKEEVSSRQQAQHVCSPAPSLPPCALHNMHALQAMHGSMQAADSRT